MIRLRLPDPRRGPVLGRRRFVVGAAASAGFVVAGPPGGVATAFADGGKKVTRTYGLTLGTALKYGPGFGHLDYVNPDAPKTGAARFHAIGGFDSFNPFIIKGEPAEGMGMVFETLTTSTNDDMLSEYGLIAGTIEVPDDLSYVVYYLRPEARFTDGTPITPDDVIFSLDVLRRKGNPLYRFYYANIARAEKRGERGVRFVFSGPKNRELPQITGQIPVLSRAYWSKRDFAETTLDPPLGSGPYRVKAFEPNRYILFERVRDWWGKDLPINRGRYNFDTVRYDYYRDATIALVAFKAHLYDIRIENSSLAWATGYDFPARSAGKVILKEIPEARPAGMQAFVFNIRRAKFRDRTLRWALSHAFDFEWSNKHLFYGQYVRTKSYFANSELAARMPPSAAELALLEPLRGKVPDEVFTRIYEPPVTDGSGVARANLVAAQTMLLKAGWRIVDDRLMSPHDGRPLDIEFLLVASAFERVIAPMIRNMHRLGVTAHMRIVDTAQYQNRVRAFDYDVIVGSFPQSLSPGNEQRNFWDSATADRPGSRNLIGIKDEAIDRLVAAIIDAPDRASLVTACRALDRVLLWHHYVIPNWYINKDRIAWWDRFGVPKIIPKFGADFFAWWIDVERDRGLVRHPVTAQTPPAEGG